MYNNRYPNSGVPARSPFATSNSSVTGPLFCACTSNPLGAYADAPFCHNGPQDHNGLRTPEQTLAFGPENYQGYYGQAYKLGFPDYGGPVYQRTIPAFNTGANALDMHGPFVVLGSKTSPYFRVYNAPQK